MASDASGGAPSWVSRLTAPRVAAFAGTYSYICSIHPFMHGIVVVTP